MESREEYCWYYWQVMEIREGILLKRLDHEELNLGTMSPYPLLLLCLFSFLSHSWLPWIQQCFSVRLSTVMFLLTTSLKPLESAYHQVRTLKPWTRNIFAPFVFSGSWLQQWKSDQHRNLWYEKEWASTSKSKIIGNTKHLLA